MVASPARVAVLVGAAGAAVLLAGTSPTLSGWTSASVGNSTNDAANAALAFSHSYPSGSCAATARGSGTVSCAGTPGPTAQVTGGGISAVDTITNNGTLTAAQLVSEGRQIVCAVEDAALAELLCRRLPVNGQDTAKHVTLGPDEDGDLTVSSERLLPMLAKNSFLAGRTGLSAVGA